MPEQGFMVCDHPFAKTEATALAPGVLGKKRLSVDLVTKREGGCLIRIRLEGNVVHWKTSLKVRALPGKVALFFGVIADLVLLALEADELHVTGKGSAIQQK